VQFQPVPSAPANPVQLGCDTIRISDVILGLNAHHDQVIVRFVDEAYESAYVFSPEVARHMRDGLIQKLGEIEAAKPRRTNQ
jgi:hypothetical protein